MPRKVGTAIVTIGFHQSQGWRRCNPDGPTSVRADTCGTEGARPTGAAANTSRKGYLRPVVLESSVNVIVNPSGSLRYRRLSRMCPRTLS
jgi:hypothetical protein